MPVTTWNAPRQPEARQAREALGSRLREIRLEARLTARALAQLAGWHFTKVSKLEHGTRRPSPDDISTWCRHCRAEDQVTDLIATACGIDAMYTEWRRQMRAGMRHFQGSLRRLYEQTLMFRVYETTFIPGLLSTAGYAAAILEFWAGLMSLPADVGTAVATRMDRQSVLYSGQRSFLFVLEEQALRTRVGGPEVMAGQLDQLLALMSLPTVSLGIIPDAGDRHALAQGSFWILDETRVQVETVSAGLDITQPTEISLYAQVFDLLRRSAVHGSGARDLIKRARAGVSDGNSANFRQHP
jgi:transcriptional regulator with XRE-family HTH domain